MYIYWRRRQCLKRHSIISARSAAKSLRFPLQVTDLGAFEGCQELI